MKFDFAESATYTFLACNISAQKIWGAGDFHALLRYMVSFSSTQTPVVGIGEIHCYVGAPDCAAFYAWILQTLEALMHPGFGPPSPPLTKITTGQMGNLGEAITFLIGHTERFASGPFIAKLGSALTPFNPSAVTGVDIIFIYLDPNGIVANDRLFIQEIKTTGAAELGYSTALIDDYQKLLDTTKPTLSLMSRVSSLKCSLMWEHRLSQSQVQRVEDLAQPSPSDCTRIRLLPTLVHDRNSNPVAALSHVMTEIQNQGWPQGCIEAWSISIAQLNQALLHMANRIPFTP
ncbi:hypothetical protein [Sideroxydans sp.]